VARRPFLALFLLQLRHAEVDQIFDVGTLGRLRWAWANPNSASVEYLKTVCASSGLGEWADPGMWQWSQHRDHWSNGATSRLPLRFARTLSLVVPQRSVVAEVGRSFID
jgi:hypothetical protein